LLAFLRAAVSASDYIRNNPRRSQVDLERWLGLETGDLDHFMATTQFEVHLNVPEMKESTREELRWLQTRQPGVAVPEDLSRFIDSSLLKSVNPASVKE
jgi:hypothetical protein